MNGWKIGGLVIVGLAAIGAAVFGINWINDQKRMERTLIDMEEEKSMRQRQKELKENGYRMDDERTAEELKAEIRRRFNEMGLKEPEYYDLAFTENGLLVAIDFA